jgi:predicted nucleotidyltransferase
MADDSAKRTLDESNLEKIVEIFHRHGVEFLIIGGQAEAIMGSPRITYDTDLCYRRTPENLARLAEALKEIKPTLRGAPPDLPLILDVQAFSFCDNYTFNTEFGSLDLLGWVEPLGTFETLGNNSESYELGSVTVRTIGLDDLIRVKEHLGRAKDRDSLYQLLAIKRIRNETKDARK